MIAHILTFEPVHSIYEIQSISEPLASLKNGDLRQCVLVPSADCSERYTPVTRLLEMAFSSCSRQYTTNAMLIAR